MMSPDFHFSPPVAVIGGTGMNTWPGLVVEREEAVHTPYGSPSGPVFRGRLEGVPVLFFARHGVGHTIPPHAINYRANVWALHQCGAQAVVAIAAVGGIAPELAPGTVAMPHDLIDYTWGRAHTFSDGGPGSVLSHVEFTQPYAPALRDALQQAAHRAGVELVAQGVMGVTQGPRLESAAEISRMRRDGCDMVGMTGMPEAALMRELGVDYAALAVSVNWAAGLGEGDIHGEIERSLATGMDKVKRMLSVLVGTMKTAGS
jgi:5'-methylthioinosine phosphorylase